MENKIASSFILSQPNLCEPHTYLPHISTLSLKKSSTTVSSSSCLISQSSHPTLITQSKPNAMATATLSVSTARLITSSNRFAHVKNMNPMVVSALRPIAGLRAYNTKVTSVGASEPGFGNPGTSLMGSLSLRGRGGGRGRGSLLVARNAASEIFKIAAIMNGLVLIGVAVGFILLRIEAAIEEAEE